MGISGVTVCAFGLAGLGSMMIRKVNLTIQAGSGNFSSYATTFRNKTPEKHTKPKTEALKPDYKL